MHYIFTIHDLLSFLFSKEILKNSIIQMAIHIHISSSLSFSQFSSNLHFKSPPLISPHPSFLSHTTTIRSLDVLSLNRNTVSVVVPKASSTASFSPEIIDVLGDVDIFTASGDSVMFNQLWDQSEGIVVVALLRHFGCPCCWELASTLKESIPKFESSGVKLIAIGIGEPKFESSGLKESIPKFGELKKARIFAERLPFPMDSLYADPERRAYDLLGLYYGIGRTFFNPASAKVLSRSRFEALKKATKNYTIEVTPDDRASVLQQGGMFVFKGKELLYARKDEGTGDHAPLDDIFNICCKVPVP